MASNRKSESIIRLKEGFKLVVLDYVLLFLVCYFVVINEGDVLPSLMLMIVMGVTFAIYGQLENKRHALKKYSESKNPEHHIFLKLHMLGFIMSLLTKLIAHTYFLTLLKMISSNGWFDGVESIHLQMAIVAIDAVLQISIIHKTALSVFMLLRYHTLQPHQH